MNILFLDDDETRHKFFTEWFYSVKGDGDILISVRSAKECIDTLKNKGPFDLAFLDHDLGGEIFVTKVENTGYEVALFIEMIFQLNKETIGTKIPKSVVVHSYNKQGADRMLNVLNKICEEYAHWHPFGPDLKQMLIMQKYDEECKKNEKQV